MTTSFQFVSYKYGANTYLAIANNPDESYTPPTITVLTTSKTAPERHYSDGGTEIKDINVVDLAVDFMDIIKESLPIGSVIGFNENRNMISMPTGYWSAAGQITTTGTGATTIYFYKRTS